MILVLPTVEMSLGRESARDRCGVLIDRDHYGTVVADGERCSPLAFCATSGIHQLVLWHQPLPLLRQRPPRPHRNEECRGASPRGRRRRFQARPGRRSVTQRTQRNPMPRPTSRGLARESLGVPFGRSRRAVGTGESIGPIERLQRDWVESVGLKVLSG